MVGHVNGGGKQVRRYAQRLLSLEVQSIRDDAEVNADDKAN